MFLPAKQPCVLFDQTFVCHVDEAAGCTAVSPLKESAQNVACIVNDSSEEPLIALLHQLHKVWLIWRTVATSLTAAKECFDALDV